MIETPRRPNCGFEHPVKDRYLGAKTGDWVCRTCEATWSRSEPQPTLAPCQGPDE